MEVLSEEQIEILTYKVAYLVKHGWVSNCYDYNPSWSKEGIRKTDEDAKVYKNNRYDYDDPPDYWYDDFTLDAAYYRQLEEDNKKESLEDKIKYLLETVDKLVTDVRSLNSRFNVKGSNTRNSPYTLTSFKMK